MELAIRVQTANDLVLRWHVKLLHYTIQFLAQFYILLIEFDNLTIFLGKQEFQIFYLVLSLAALSLPFEVGTVHEDRKNEPNRRSFNFRGIILAFHTL